MQNHHAATQPDKIEPQSPDEAPPFETPDEAPMQEPPEISPPQPDYDDPDRGVPETPPFPQAPD